MNHVIIVAGDKNGPGPLLHPSGTQFEFARTLTTPSFVSTQQRTVIDVRRLQARRSLYLFCQELRIHQILSALEIRRNETTGWNIRSNH